MRTYIFKQLVRADELSDWELQFFTLQKILPFFAAIGHHNYTKFLWLYLEKLNFQMVMWNSKNVSAPFIELMISLKSRGGLTRGMDLMTNKEEEKRSDQHQEFGTSSLV